jgi:hypothetical protein
MDSFVIMVSITDPGGVSKEAEECDTNRGPGKKVRNVEDANSSAKRMLAMQWEVQGTPMLRLRIE